MIITGDSSTVTLTNVGRVDFSTSRKIVNYVFNDNTDIQEDEGKTSDNITVSGVETSSVTTKMEKLNTIMDNSEEVTVTDLPDNNLNTDYHISDLQFNQQPGWTDRYSFSITLERLYDQLG